MFPARVAHTIRNLSGDKQLLEVVFDLGFAPSLRFKESVMRLHDLGEVTQADLQLILKQLRPFNSDNRTGIARTLHRISAIRNREGDILGLTCRIGRAVSGTVDVIKDLIESNRSCLFLGPPGIGKTTILRETARVLSERDHKRVVVVDTSNEIAGDGDIPHQGIGFARRMQVPSPDLQHAVMIEAVENHTPEVIIVDEIGTEAEAMAARTIAERGVQLIATAHGRSLENLLKNPTLSDMLGGIQSVVLGDEEAKFRGTNKTVLERKTQPTFDVLIEIRSRDVFVVYDPVIAFVDALLLQHEKLPAFRTRGNFEIEKESSKAQEGESKNKKIQPPLKTFTFFVYGIREALFLSAIHALKLPLKVVYTLDEADMLFTLEKHMKAKGKLKQMIKSYDIETHILPEATTEGILHFLRRLYRLPLSVEHLEEDVVRETQAVCSQVKQKKKTAECAPQSAYLRRLQHQVVYEAGLNSMSVGDEPNRRVRVYPVLRSNQGQGA